MKLHPPFIISARLLPALRIGDATLSLDSDAVFWLDLPDGTEHRIDDFHPGASRDPVDWFAAICDFLCAAAESRQHRERRGESEIDPDGNEGLFPPSVAEWAAANSDEIACCRCEIQDDSGCALSELIEQEGER